MPAYNVIPWPFDLAPASQQFYLEAQTQAFPGSISRRESILAAAPPLWKVVMTFDNVPDDWSRRIDAIIDQMNGRQNVVQLFDFRRKQPLGTGIGFSLVSWDGFPFYMYSSTYRPQVFGVGQTGNMITTYGWPASQYVLKQGDYVQLDTNVLVRMVDDIYADANGYATLNCRPFVRNAPADGTYLVTNYASALFRLDDDKMASNNTTPPLFSSYSLELRQIITP